MPQSGVRFSSRTPADLTPSRLARVREAAGEVPFDLTVSNPTAAGIAYPEGLLAPLASPAGLAYAPDPRGLASAREAVAAEYARLGIAVDPGRIVLTASTSEAYAFAFKLLCEPGEHVLVPCPSYPLFEHLARVEGVEAVPYRLDADAAWRVELADVAAAPADTRAVIVVHPNNPTGSHVHPDDAAALSCECRRRGAALVADEVFLPYPLDEVAPPARSFAAASDALTFTLGGLSKSVGLPQLKVGWIVVSGPENEVAEALDRLAFVADTFLSVATPAQLALPRLLAEGRSVRDAIATRCRGNLRALGEAVRSLPELTLLAPEGGWSAVVRYPAVVDEEELAVELLRRDGVAVQPGYFYDFARSGHVVVSLLPPGPVFTGGLERLLERLRAHLA